MADKTESDTQEKTVKLLTKTINCLTELTNEVKINSLELNQVTANSKNSNKYLQHLDNYMQQVGTMITTLKDAEMRMQVIEDLALFFKQERGNLKVWNGVVSKSIAEVDETLQESVALLKESIAAQIQELTNFIIAQREHFEKYIEEQNKLVTSKATELTIITDELHNLLGVKEGIQELQKLAQEQNRKFDILADSIYKLMYEEAQKNSLRSKRRFPNWIKVLIIVITIGVLGIFTVTLLNYTNNSKRSHLDDFEQFDSNIPMYNNNKVIQKQ